MLKDAVAAAMICVLIVYAFLTISHRGVELSSGNEGCDGLDLLFM